jgi:hypothetical protein
MTDYKEKLKSSDNDTSKICEYLIKKCEESKEFKNEVESRDRTVSGMMKYIMNKARHKEHNGMAMITDSTVFNWAFDYFHDETLGDDEDDVEIEKNEPAEEPVKKAVSRTTKKQEKDEPTVERMTLFDL